MRMLVICLMMFSLNSCSGVSKGFTRKFTARTYRPCKPVELKEYQGNWCYRKCIKYKFLKRRKSENCAEWKYDIINAHDYHEKLLDGSWRLITQERI